MEWINFLKTSYACSFDSAMSVVEPVPDHILILKAYFVYFSSILTNNVLRSWQNYAVKWCWPGWNGLNDLWQQIISYIMDGVKYFIIYPTCINPSDKQQFAKKYTCKPFQNHAKCPQGIPLYGNEVSDAFNHTRMGVFMKNMWKCTKEISHDLGCRSAVW
jgi:hypothetical protein